MRDLETILAGQLGRPMRGRVEVKAACPFGFPAVIETGPYLEDGSPFPTLFYLTCPFARQVVGRREAGGGVAYVRRLAAEGGSAAAFLELLEDSYRKRRRHLASGEEGADRGAVLESGIGGTSGLDRLSCLHALAAALLVAREGGQGFPAPEDPGYAPFSEEAAKILEWLGPLWCGDARCADWEPETVRVAAVDVGTNSTRLLVADGGAGVPRTVRRRAVVTRLGEGAGAGGSLAREPVLRTMKAIRKFVGEARELGAERVLVAGTSAVREMAAARELLKEVGTGLGVETRVLSGEEEGRLAYEGATLDVEGDYLLLDVGGGSTEFAGRDRHGAVRVVSVDIGCVRQVEKWVAHDPPQEEERANIRSEAGEAFAPVLGRLGGEGSAPSCLLGVAGTVSTLACGILGLDSYDPDRTHHARLAREDLRTYVDELAHMTNRQRRELSCMQEGRERVIVAGGEILLTAMDVLGSRQVLVSERDILDGLVVGLVE